MTLNNDFGSSVCHKPKGIYYQECKNIGKVLNLFLFEDIISKHLLL